MRTRGTLTLWMIAFALVIATVVVALYRPAPRARRAVDDELAATIAKAETYYEFGHFDRAAQTYRTAVDRGMEDAGQWARYAEATRLSTGLNVHLYLEAYRRLLAAGAGQDSVSPVEQILAENAAPFVYGDIAGGSAVPGALYRIIGTVSRITWGRVESGMDTLIVETGSPSGWRYRLGDTVAVDMPRHRRYQTGETIEFFALYEGPRAVSNGAGVSRTLPGFAAAGGRVADP